MMPLNALAVDWQPLVTAVAGFIVLQGVPVATLLIVLANRKRAARTEKKVDDSASKLDVVHRDTNGNLAALNERIDILEEQLRKERAVRGAPPP